MAFCSKCGTQIEDGVKFCPNCGAPIAAQEEKKAEQSAQNDFQSKIASLNDTADTTADFDPADIQNNKAMAILAYLSWLVLIPLFAAKESKFARFHANQGIVLAIAEIALWIIGLIPILGWILGVIGNIAAFVLAVLGIINAANGKAKELPIIGKFRILK